MVREVRAAVLRAAVDDFVLWRRGRHPIHRYDVQTFVRVDFTVVDDIRQTQWACKRLLMDLMEANASNQELYMAALEDLKTCSEPWAELREAILAHFYMHDEAKISRHMERLRKLIGPENYCKGVMPPAIPYWWFPRAD